VIKNIEYHFRAHTKHNIIECQLDVNLGGIVQRIKLQSDSGNNKNLKPTYLLFFCYYTKKNTAIKLTYVFVSHT